MELSLQRRQMSIMTSQITDNSVINPRACLWFVSLSLCGMKVDSFYKRSVMRKAFSCHDVIIPWVSWLRLVQMAIGCGDFDKTKIIIADILLHKLSSGNLLNQNVKFVHIQFVSNDEIPWAKHTDFETLSTIGTYCDKSRTGLLHIKFHTALALIINFHNPNEPIVIVILASLSVPSQKFHWKRHQRF